MGRVAGRDGREQRFENLGFKMRFSIGLTGECHTDAEMSFRNASDVPAMV